MGNMPRLGDGAGDPCECDGRYCGLFNESESSTHERSLQGLQLRGVLRRQTNCVGRRRLTPVLLMLEDARASTGIVDGAASICAACDAKYAARRRLLGCVMCGARLAVAGTPGAPAAGGPVVYCACVVAAADARGERATADVAAAAATAAAAAATVAALRAELAGARSVPRVGVSPAVARQLGAYMAPDELVCVWGGESEHLTEKAL